LAVLPYVEALSRAVRDDKSRSLASLGMTGKSRSLAALGMTTWADLGLEQLANRLTREVGA
jgi:hypothetical protein